MPRLNLPELLLAPLIEPQWVVSPWLPRGTFVVLCGSAGVGKSYLAYSLSFAVALGLPFLGSPTTQTRVLYVDEENSTPDLSGYLQWAWHALSCPQVADLGDHLIVEHCTLSKNWEEHLTHLVKVAQPGLLLIDTATPALRIKDENDNALASLAIQSLRRVQRAAGNDTTVLVLKHQRDDDEGRLVVRGAKAWVSMADQVIFHTIAPGRPRKDGLRGTRLIPEKVRRFGLRETIRVIPEWTGPERRGLILRGEQLETPPTLRAPSE